MSDHSPHIDRTITFGLILTVLVQTAGALLWAGGTARGLRREFAWTVWTLTDAIWP